MNFYFKITIFVFMVYFSSRAHVKKVILSHHLLFRTTGYYPMMTLQLPTYVLVYSALDRTVLV